MLISINAFIIGIIFILTSYTEKTKCQSESNTEIEINKTYNGTMDKKDSFRFFKMIIPNDVEKDMNNLIFRVQEPESAREGRDDFSDPDIYVSTV